MRLAIDLSCNGKEHGCGGAWSVVADVFFVLVVLAVVAVAVVWLLDRRRRRGDEQSKPVDGQF
jgi:hypothetical protein